MLWKSEAGPGRPTIWSQPLAAGDMALTGVPAPLLPGRAGSAASDKGRWVATSGTIAGPGGADLFVDAAGRPDVAFHAWNPAAIGYPNNRLLFLRHVSLFGGVPVFTV